MKKKKKKRKEGILVCHMFGRKERIMFTRMKIGGMENIRKNEKKKKRK